VYEDLEPIATLKFGKEMETISERTRANVREAQCQYAALTGSSGTRSGQHEASIARIWINGSEQLARSLFDLWIDLIKQRNGHIARADVGFVAMKIEGFTKTQTVHLKQVIRQRHSAIIPMLTEEAERRMYAASSSARRDLEIMAREHEAFSKSATAAHGAPAPHAPEPRPPNAVGTPSPLAEKPDKGLFVGIFGIAAALVLFTLQANGVDLNWPASFVLYIASACACAWSFWKHAVPNKGPLTRYGGAFLFLAVIVAIGFYGAAKQYRREHPLADMQPISKSSEVHPPHAAGEPSSASQNHNRPKSQSPAKPEVIDFNSTAHVVLSNNSNESIFVLNLVATAASAFLPASQSASYSLDAEIEPKKTQDVKVGPQESWETIQPTMGSLQEQWKTALETYKSCTRVVYFSPSNAGLKQMQDHFRAYGAIFPVGEASGTISYKTHNAPTVMEESFPLKVVLVKLTGCQP
jgi:hypothetical protein